MRKSVLLAPFSLLLTTSAAYAEEQVAKLNWIFGIDCITGLCKRYHNAQNSQNLPTTIPWPPTQIPSGFTFKVYRTDEIDANIGTLVKQLNDKQIEINNLQSALKRLNESMDSLSVRLSEIEEKIKK